MTEERERDLSGLLSTVSALSRELGGGKGASLSDLSGMMPMLLKMAEGFKSDPAALGDLMSMLGGENSSACHETDFFEKRHCDQKKGQKCNQSFTFKKKCNEDCHDNSGRNACRETNEECDSACPDCLCKHCRHAASCHTRHKKHSHCREACGDRSDGESSACCEENGGGYRPFRDPLDPRRRHEDSDQCSCVQCSCECENCKQFISTGPDAFHFFGKNPCQNEEKMHANSPPKRPEKWVKHRACRRPPMPCHHGCEEIPLSLPCPPDHTDCKRGKSCQGREDRENLLCALRPFLPKERQEKLLQILKIAELFRIFEMKGE